MITNLLLEYTGFIFLVYLFLSVSERRKPRMLILILGLFASLFLEVALQLVKEFDVINGQLSSQILLSVQIFVLGFWLAIYKEAVNTKARGSFVSDFSAVIAGIVILELAVWLNIISFSAEGTPDLILYMIIPFLSLIILSYLTISAKDMEKQTVYSSKFKDGNLLLPPMIIFYIFFVHVLYPFTQSMLPVAIFYMGLIFLSWYWVIRIKIIDFNDNLLWFVIPISSAFISIAIFTNLKLTASKLPILNDTALHFVILFFVMFFVAIIYWSYAEIRNRIRPENQGFTVTNFVQDLYKYLSWERFGIYVCNHFIRRFNTNRVALIIEGNGNNAFRILGQLNTSEVELNQLLKSKEIDWFEQLRKSDLGLFTDALPKDSVIQLAFQSFKIGAVLPIKVEASVRGMIMIADDREIPYFSNDEKEEMRLLMVQIALAIEQLERTEKYYQNEKMAEIGAFASQLAHDFRSFLSVIQLAPESTPFLKNMARQTGAMIQDLLTFVRPDELSFMPTDFNSLLDNSLEMINVPEEIKVEKQYDPDLPSITADFNQMNRVFTNLLNNAVRAVMVKKGGRIKISTRKLRIFNIFENKEWIYVEILDEGEGIPETNMEKIFQPFFTSYKEQGGSGLGLSIVKKIIQAHGGSIDVTSVIGKGTAFNIRLPVRANMEIK